MPNVFISYTHDTPEHKGAILALSERLRDEGIHCEIDQYHESPPEGWPTWMERQLRCSEFVLVVCSVAYKRRFEGAEIEGIGKGVKFESFLALNEIHANDTNNRKFIPIVVKESDIKHIPNFFKAFTYYNISEPKSYLKLYRVLTNQPEIVKNAVGSIKNLTGFSDDEEHIVVKRLKNESCWNHETTERESYVPRANEIVTLQTCYKKSASRIVSLVGVGGTGKTSLLGHWLKTDYECLKERDISGIFYWSFYSESNIGQFLEKLFLYLEKVSRLDIKRKKKDVFELLQSNWNNFKPIIIALDGLEVMQETLGEGNEYGAFIDLRIRDLLFMIATSKLPWFSLLTSRFPISDLFKLRGCSALKLEGLNNEEGAELLFSSGVTADHAQLQNISDFFQGHPLALLVFSSSLPIEHRLSPKTHLDKLFVDGPWLVLETKLLRLLQFYKENLEENQRVSLACLSIFRSPVPQKTIESLFPGIKQQLSDKTLEDPAIAPEIVHLSFSRLNTSGLLILDKINNEDVYSCHPVIRDFFRSEITGSDVAAAEFTANVLVNQPDMLGLVGVSSIENLILSIELLLQSEQKGNLRFAFDIFTTRLERGHVILNRGLALEGKRCFESFVKYFDNHNVSDLKLRIPFEIRWFEMCYHLGEFQNILTRYDLIKGLGSSSFRSALHKIYSKTCLRLGRYKECIEASESSIKIDSGLLNQNDGSADSIYIALYIKTQCLLQMGQISKAKKLIAEFDALDDLVDKSYSDSTLVKAMASSWIALYSDDKKQVNKSLNTCMCLKGQIQNLFLETESKILYVFSYLFLKQHDKAISLASEMRKDSLQKNVPYEHLLLCYLIEKLNFETDKTPEEGVLEQISIQSKEMGFVFIQSLISNLQNTIAKKFNCDVSPVTFIGAPDTFGVKPPLFLTTDEK